MDRKCQDCANRFICPTYKENDCCDGYNDKDVFAGLIIMSMFPFADIEQIKDRLKFIEKLQKGE